MLISNTNPNFSINPNQVSGGLPSQALQMMQLMQNLMNLVFSMMMGGQQSGPFGQGMTSQQSPNFGQSGCPCGGGSNPIGQFLGGPTPATGGNGQALLPPSTPSQPIAPSMPNGAQGQGVTPPTDSQAGQLPPANTSTSQTPSAGGQSYNGDINVQSLVNTLPASRRQAASQHFPTILAECQRQGVNDRDQIAYILATATHESNAGQTMEEFASGRAYEGRSSLGNTQSGDGPRFKGRGYVQITGRRNYTDWSRRLGMDLVGNPSLATQPSVASRILVEGMMRGTFTGRSLSDYVGNGRRDFSNARRVVNGTDRAGDIAGIAQRLRSAMA